MTQLIAPWSGFQVGAVVQPLSTASSNTLLQDADPAIFYALDFLAYVITTYPGPRLVQAATGANVGPQVIALQAAVAQKYPWLPDPIDLGGNQFQFPLLCIGRTKGKVSRHTAGHDRDFTGITLLYILPPMDVAQKELLLPILVPVMQAIRRKTSQGGDPGYTPPGGTLGQSPWGAGFGGVEEIGWGAEFAESDDVEYGHLEGAGNLVFPCLRMTGYIGERDEFNAVAQGAQTLTGFDITADLVAGDGTVIDPFIQASVSATGPTITGLSVSTGTANGGTAVVITGAGFIQGATVYFGSYVYAPTVSFSSSTSLTVLTPVMQGASAVPVQVVVTNPVPDGRSAALPAAFTFT